MYRRSTILLAVAITTFALPCRAMYIMTRLSPTDASVAVPMMRKGGPSQPEFFALVGFRALFDLNNYGWGWHEAEWSADGIPGTLTDPDLGAHQGITACAMLWQEPGTYQVKVRAKYDGLIFGIHVWTAYLTWTVEVYAHPPSASCVSPDSPVTLDKGATQVFTVLANDRAGDLDGVTWYLNGAPQGEFDLSGGEDTRAWSHTFDTAGTYGVEARVSDSVYGYGGEASIVTWTVVVENHEPSATIQNPSSSTTAYTGIPVIFTVAGTDPDNDLSRCEVRLNGGFQGDASFSGNTASWTHTFDTVGTYTVAFLPLDQAGHSGSAVEWTVGVESHAPSATSVSPSSPVTIVQGTEVTFIVEGTDPADDLEFCMASLEGVFQTYATFSGSGSGSTASWTHTFNTPGQYAVALEPLDAGGSYGSGSVWTVVVKTHGPAVVEVHSPSATIDSPVSPASIFPGQQMTFTVLGNDAANDLHQCAVYLDGTFQGYADFSDPNSGSTASWTHTFTMPGTFRLLLQPVDVGGNSGSAGVWTIVVERPNPSGSIKSPPTPVQARVGDTIPFTMHGTDPDGDLLLSEVYLGGVLQTTVTYGDGQGVPEGTTTWTHTFDTPGTYRVAFNCLDCAGNYGPGGSWEVRIGEQLHLEPTEPVQLAYNFTKEGADAHGGTYRAGKPKDMNSVGSDTFQGALYGGMLSGAATGALGGCVVGLIFGPAGCAAGALEGAVVGAVGGMVEETGMTFLGAMLAWYEDDPNAVITFDGDSPVFSQEEVWSLKFSLNAWTQEDVGFTTFWQYGWTATAEVECAPVIALTLKGEPGESADIEIEHELTHGGLIELAPGDFGFDIVPVKASSNVSAEITCLIPNDILPDYEYSYDPSKVETGYSNINKVQSMPGQVPDYIFNQKIGTMNVGETLILKADLHGGASAKVWSWGAARSYTKPTLRIRLTAKAANPYSAGTLQALAADDPPALWRVHNTTQNVHYATIQAAIDNAIPGDRIEVDAGIYAEAIDLQGKALTLSSRMGPGSTLIKGAGTAPAVRCVSGEGPDTVLYGFTLTTASASDPNVSPVDYGGGLLNDHSSPTVSGCLFAGCRALDGAGMANTNGSHPVVVNCGFVRNVARDSGGALWNSENSSPTLINCIFIGNEAASGGALANAGASSPMVVNCTFIGNKAASGGALANLMDSSPTLTNCILWGDTPEEIASLDGTGQTTITYSDIQGGWPGAGNLNADPLFVDPNLGDLRLRAGSPCIDAGDNTVSSLPAMDLAGQPRVANGDDDEGAVVDMGAYEYGVVAVCNVTQGTSHTKIQRAIDTAVAGDVIMVLPGTYNEAIDFKGKAITLRSSRGSGATTINGNGAYHVVRCTSGEDANTVLEGFTITGGNAEGSAPDDLGGGMLCLNSSPTVTDCIFMGNAAVAGGAMCNTGGSPTVTNCAFMNNSASGKGAALFNDANSPTLINCVFMGNVAGANGGAISNRNAAPRLINCTFSRNVAVAGGGMASQDDSEPTVANCIFWGDTPDEIVSTDSSITVTYSDVQGGWPGTGNIDADPLFVDAQWNLCLQSASPCVDAGDNRVSGLPETDLARRPRLADNPDRPDTGSGTPPIVDMGAIEWFELPELEP
jgi:pectin methylesterase-like acyl-CoA thioesterase/plastocyanin